MQTCFPSRRPLITALVLVVAGSWAVAEPIYDDPLTGSDPGVHLHPAAAVVGGRFVAEGWQSVKSSDQLYYVLPADLTAATVEFEVKGIRIGMPPARQHIVGVYSLRKEGAQDIKGDGTDLDGLTLRIYHTPHDQHVAGETRFRIGGASYPKTQGTNEKPLSWDPDRWYKLTVSWDRQMAVWRRDGEVIATLTYPAAPVVLRHLYLNNDNHAGFKGLTGAIYRHLRITRGVGVPVDREPATGGSGNP